MKLIKKFKDGTLMVLNDDATTTIVEQEQYDSFHINNLVVTDEILTELKWMYPHCVFDFRNEMSRDFLYMDGEVITNVASESLEFTFKSQKFHIEDAVHYIKTEIVPGIAAKIDEVEIERCKDMEYFYKYYSKRNKTNKD